MSIWYINGIKYYSINKAAKQIGIDHQVLRRRFAFGNIPGAIPRTENGTVDYHPRLIPEAYVLLEEERLKKSGLAKERLCGAISKIPDYKNLNRTEKIRMVREVSELSGQEIANILGVSVMLMDILEEGGVTHPKLAKKIGRVYKMGNSEIESMMPVNHRKHGKQYDPDKYKDPVDIYGMNSDYFGRERYKDEGYEKIRSEIFKKGTCKANH